MLNLTPSKTYTLFGGDAQNTCHYYNMALMNHDYIYMFDAHSPRTNGRVYKKFSIEHVGSFSSVSGTL